MRGLTRHRRQRLETGRFGLLSSSLPFFAGGTLQNNQKRNKAVVFVLFSP
jgi:hypothetical protein